MQNSLFVCTTCNHAHWALNSIRIMNILYHEDYWPHFQCWVSCVTIFTLLNRLSCSWYTFSDSGKYPAIPEITTSSRGLDCRDCRLGLMNTGMADSNSLLSWKQKYGRIMHTELELAYPICHTTNFKVTNLWQNKFNISRDLWTIYRSPEKINARSN
jgi:hypothetical protein